MFKVLGFGSALFNLRKDGDGLTPEEIENFLNKSEFNGALARQIRSVLDQCDKVRYGRNSDRLAEYLQPQVSEAVMKILEEHRHKRR